MTPMTQATVAMLRTFLRDELAARLATSTAVDLAEWTRAEAAARAHLSSEPGVALDLGFTRAPASAPPTPPAVTGERVLFAVTRVALSNGEEVFHAYVGDEYDPEGSQYGEALTIAMIEGVPKIVGRAGSSPFGPPDRLTWESLAGRDFDAQADAVEAVTFQRPIDPASAAHYDTLRAIR